MASIKKALNITRPGATNAHKPGKTTKIVSTPVGTKGISAGMSKRLKIAAGNNVTGNNSKSIGATKKPLSLGTNNFNANPAKPGTKYASETKNGDVNSGPTQGSTNVPTPVAKKGKTYSKLLGAKANAKGIVSKIGPK